MIADFCKCPRRNIITLKALYYEVRKFEDFGDTDIKALYFSEIIWVCYTYMRYIHFRKLLYSHICVNLKT